MCSLVGGQGAAEQDRGRPVCEHVDRASESPRKSTNVVQGVGWCVGTSEALRGLPVASRCRGCSDQLAGFHAERQGEPLEEVKADTAGLVALVVGDRLSTNPDGVGEVLLGQPTALAELLESKCYRRHTHEAIASGRFLTGRGQGANYCTRSAHSHSTLSAYRLGGGLSD